MDLNAFNELDMNLCMTRRRGQWRCTLPTPWLLPEKEEDWRAISDEEMCEPISDLAEHKSLVLYSLGGVAELPRPKGGWTGWSLVEAIEKVETLTRPQTDWLGGVDIHHVIFEGLVPHGNGFRLCWGS